MTVRGVKSLSKRRATPNSDNSVNITLGGDSVKPLLTFFTLWTVLLGLVGTVALTALIIAMQAKTEARLSEYAYSQMREFMSQKGYPLPPDPKEHGK